eukprot:6315009-Pyramimonas_sp.AAC.1
MMRGSVEKYEEGNGDEEEEEEGEEEDREDEEEEEEEDDVAYDSPTRPIGRVRQGIPFRLLL